MSFDRKNPFAVMYVWSLYLLIGTLLAPKLGNLRLLLDLGAMSNKSTRRQSSSGSKRTGLTKDDIKAMVAKLIILPPVQRKTNEGHRLLCKVDRCKTLARSEKDDMCKVRTRDHHNMTSLSFCCTNVSLLCSVYMVISDLTGLPETLRLVQTGWERDEGCTIKRAQSDLI